ncbi:MAG: hypothetical protein AAF604_14590 [Acidobacteriota bacterium]
MVKKRHLSTRIPRLGWILAFGLMFPGTLQGLDLPSELSTLTHSAEQVFQGTCVAVREATVEVGGARLAATTYVFEVHDHLKGTASRRVEFRQVGRPEGGPGDLGFEVGLPTYRVGTDYLLFLLPASRVGLTSPAGAAEGAFRLVGDRVQPLATGHGLRLPPTESFSYDALRAAVRREMAP